ncbi:UNKNOWN [Stylonychia lemnae]|uniref:Uncharacterized protein n=1 Tax=Stylonychia lemnae TaxID=5949 RepID=A0A078AQM7_STYLE|nr:UNKNOWN [Stylonychia lemnae]|eukprot:CDW84740.1 UNKNOWN [Stylonychia lemnae]
MSQRRKFDRIRRKKSSTNYNNRLTNLLMNSAERIPPDQILHQNQYFESQDFNYPKPIPRKSNPVLQEQILIRSRSPLEQSNAYKTLNYQAGYDSQPSYTQFSRVPQSKPPLPNQQIKMNNDYLRDDIEDYINEKSRQLAMNESKNKSISPTRQEKLFDTLKEKLRSYQRVEITTSTNKLRTQNIGQAQELNSHQNNVNFKISRPNFRLDPQTVVDQIRKRQFRDKYLQMHMKKEQEKVSNPANTSANKGSDQSLSKSNSKSPNKFNPNIKNREFPLKRFLKDSSIKEILNQKKLEAGDSANKITVVNEKQNQQAEIKDTKKVQNAQDELRRVLQQAKEEKLRKEKEMKELQEKQLQQDKIIDTLQDNQQEEINNNRSRLNGQNRLAQKTLAQRIKVPEIRLNQRSEKSIMEEQKVKESQKQLREALKEAKRLKELKQKEKNDFDQDEEFRKLSEDLNAEKAKIFIENFFRQQFAPLAHQNKKDFLESPQHKQSSNLFQKLLQTKQFSPSHANKMLTVIKDALKLKINELQTQLRKQKTRQELELQEQDRKFKQQLNKQVLELENLLHQLDNPMLNLSGNEKGTMFNLDNISFKGQEFDAIGQANSRINNNTNQNENEEIDNTLNLSIRTTQKDSIMFNNKFHSRIQSQTELKDIKGRVIRQDGQFSKINLNEHKNQTNQALNPQYDWNTESKARRHHQKENQQENSMIKKESNTSMKEDDKNLQSPNKKYFEHRVQHSGPQTKFKRKLKQLLNIEGHPIVGLDEEDDKKKQRRNRGRMTEHSSNQEAWKHVYPQQYSKYSEAQTT